MRALAELLFLGYSEVSLAALLRQRLPDLELPQGGGKETTPLALARLAALLLQETEALAEVLKITPGKPSR